MGKDVEWKSFFQDNHRYADIINGIGCRGVQFVKDTDLQEVDTSSKKKSRDILRRVALKIRRNLIMNCHFVICIMMSLNIKNKLLGFVRKYEVIRKDYHQASICMDLKKIVN